MDVAALIKNSTNKQDKKNYNPNFYQASNRHRAKIRYTLSLKQIIHAVYCVVQVGLAVVNEFLVGKALPSYY